MKYIATDVITVHTFQHNAMRLMMDDDHDFMLMTISSIGEIVE